MSYTRVTQLSKQQKEQIFEIWNRVYPINLNYETSADFNNYFKGLTSQNHLLLVNKKDHVLGWYFDFIRDDERWFTLLLNPSVQGKGCGTELLNLGKKANQELNGWVIDHDKDLLNNGQPYRSPLYFYKKNGFEVINDIRLELDTISAVKIKWTLK